MPSLNLRKYNQAALKAELAGETNFAGSPCKAKPEHVDEDGSTMRDTIRRTCNLCEADKRSAWLARQTG